MRLSIKDPVVFFLLFIAVISFAARVVPPLEIKTSSKKINLKNEASFRQGTISCAVGSSVLKGQKAEDIEFAFFAKNNISQHEFTLTDANYDPIKPALKKNAKGEWLILHATFSELFYKQNSTSPYRWTWQARPESPLSPLAEIREERVKKIQCWFTITVNNKTRRSKTISLDVIQ